jgi:hypothetical protein
MGVFHLALQKVPGIEYGAASTVMEMRYDDQFPDGYKGDAYERMLLR